MTNATNGKRIEREARLRWIPIPKMKVTPRAQRDFRPAWRDYLVANFDLEEVGTPTVNLRDEHFYIVDGQHRIATLKAIGWGDQQVQCWTYEGLSEQDEAEKFLRLNDMLSVKAFDKFRIGVQAGRPMECEIERVVRAQGLCVSKEKVDGAVGAVGTLERVYKRADSATLGRALRIVRDAYGDPGLEAPVIDGIALLCQRYNGAVDDVTAVGKLADAHGGVNGLLGRAENLRRQTGNQKSHCVAAAAVDIINTGVRGKTRLVPWWRS